MFEPTSRYYGVADATTVVSLSDGSTRTVSFKRRRFITVPVGLPGLQHIALQGERPDLLSARFLGDPTQFWRICDANRVIRPTELTDTAGRVIVIPVVGP
jgi:hypothetical protein